jgi:8-hydroxy-5-deazaflavin:NADPH oxidoreductase
MKIGIIGAGHIGANAARLFVKAGHEVAIGNSREPRTLESLVRELGPSARAVTAAEAAAFGDVVLEAIPFGRHPDLPAAQLAGKIVITAANYYAGRDGQIDLGGLSSSELTARHLPGARVVKAFNTIYWLHLRDEADTSRPLDERRAVFLAGDDPEAKAVVAALIEEIGFAPIDTGTLREGGRRQEPGTPVYNRSVRAAEARSLLGPLTA